MLARNGPDSERARPPGRECASVTTTRRPRSAASIAAVSPVTPAPTTVRSGSTGQASSLWRPDRKVGEGPRKVPGNLAAVDPAKVAAAQQGDALALDQLLDELPPSQRAVLVLRTREGLSEQEIATALGIPAGTVKSRLHRARASFREMWES